MTKLENSQVKLTDEEYSAWLDYMLTQCYACATQRHACEHDEIDYVKYQEGKSWEDDYEEDIC